MYPREFFDTFWRGNLRDEVFVAMPFHDEFTPVWEHSFKAGIEAAGLKASRTDTTKLSKSVITFILDGVANARFVLADISIAQAGKWKDQRNGNVMYEVGLSHALRQDSEVILVRSDSDSINFDVSGLTVNSYDREDLAGARQLVTELIEDAKRSVDDMKSLKVTTTREALDADALRVMKVMGKRDHFALRVAVSDRELMDELKSGERAGIQKLSTLGLIYCDYNPLTGQYAYHWTRLGQAVLKSLTVSA